MRGPTALQAPARSYDARHGWLQENLWLARRSLGSQVLPPGGALGWLTPHAGKLRLAAIVLAWLTLGLLIFPSRIPGWAVAVSAVLAFSLYGTAWTVHRWGPHAAVVVKRCSTAAGELPAGTEAWVHRVDDDGWLISGSGNAVCSADAVELIFPTS